MSRSNGTTDRHPAHAQPHAQGRAAQQADPGQSLPWHQLAPDAQHAPQQSGLFAAPPPPPPPQQNQQANQQAPQGYYPAQPGYPAGSDPYYGHYFTGAPQGQPAQGQPSQGQQPQGYAPQHAPQHAPQGYGQQLDPAIYAQAQAQAAAAARAAGFSPQTQQQPYTDPRSGYDLAGYATQAPSYQPQGYLPPGPQNHGYPPQGAPTYGSQQYDQQHYDQQQYDQYDPHAAQLQSGQQPDTHADDDEDYDDEPAEPKGRGRGLVVVASLIGAIALGAGLAYGYKKFGGGASAGKPAVLKAEQTPAKKAATSGDQKTAGRLDQPPPAVVAADQSASANAGTPGGPRVVQTIPISPAGTVVAGLNPPPAAQPTPPLRPTISVPGVQLDGGAPPAPQLQQQFAQPPVTPAPPGRAVAPPPVQPRVITTPEATAPVPPVARVPVAKAAPTKTKTADAFSPAGAAPATIAAATAAPTPTPAAAKANNGYVAVLSSQGSRMEALKAYADLQQKYGGVLASKPADVQEATVNGKVWYRAVVGPPGSRNAAADVCAQLKTAGHSACFPAAY